MNDRKVKSIPRRLPATHFLFIFSCARGLGRKKTDLKWRLSPPSSLSFCRINLSSLSFSWSSISYFFTWNFFEKNGHLFSSRSGPSMQHRSFTFFCVFHLAMIAPFTILILYSLSIPISYGKQINKYNQHPFLNSFPSTAGIHRAQIFTKACISLGL